MAFVPREVNYEKLREISPVVSTSSVLTAPREGPSGATANSTMTLNFLNDGRVVPNSQVITGELVVTSSEAAGYVLGCAGFSWIETLTTIIASTTAETINNYGSVAYMLMNAKMNNSTKTGLAYALGIGGSDVSQNQILDDSYYFPSGTTRIPFAVPLGNLISSSSKLFPLSGLGVQVQLIVAQASRFLYVPSGTVSFVLDNVALAYDVVRFDPQTEMMISSMADANGDIWLKTQSYYVTSNTIANATSGFIELPYNQSLRSVKSVYSLFSPPEAEKGGAFSAFDITGVAGGSIQWALNGVNYPNQAIDTIHRRPHAQVEFLAAINGTHDPIASAQCSLSPYRWKTAIATPTSLHKLPSAYFGVNTERLSTNDVLLSGTDTGNQVSVKLQIGTATAQACNSVLIMCYDMIIRYNPLTKQVVFQK